MSASAAEATASSREAEIIRAAVRMFQRDGYEGTPLSKIAKATGMTPGNLYWYFPSKLHILRAALVDLYQKTYSQLQAADDPAADAVDRLRGYVRTFVLHQLDGEEEEVNFGYIALQTALDDEARDEITRWQRQHRALIKDILQQGARAGRFHIADVSVTASMLLTSAEYVFLWYRPDGRLSREEVADEYARLALRAVGAEAP